MLLKVVFCTPSPSRRRQDDFRRECRKRRWHPASDAVLAADSPSSPSPPSAAGPIAGIVQPISSKTLVPPRRTTPAAAPRFPRTLSVAL
jgi:hypothetical protein